MNRPSDLPASNHYASNDPKVLAAEYAYLWSICTINPKFEAQVKYFCDIILSHKSEYMAVQNAIGVPWFVVASDHMREASCDFSKCLANGQPWNKKTTVVPIGAGPWSSWHDAAIWAYQHEGFANRGDWSLAMCFYRLEGFNGFGYRVGGVKDFVLHKHGNRAGTIDMTYHGSMQDTTPRNASPYIYNGTEFYKCGVSIEDHSFYPKAVDDQLGCMALLKGLEMRGEKIFDVASTPPTTGTPVTTPIAPPEETVDSKTLMALAQTVGQEKPMQALLDYRDAHLPGHHPNFWATIDFNKPSSEKRLFLFDVNGFKVTSHLVAHGKGSDPANTGMATQFSNVDGSNMSSLGICKGAELYTGDHGLTMRLKGLETSNSNMEHRAIVMHAADYVTDATVKVNGHCGRSWGCPAVDPTDKPMLIGALTGGSLINLWKNS